MSKLVEPFAIQLLEAALKAPLGIVVAVEALTDSYLAPLHRAKLLFHRLKKSNSPKFDEIKIEVSRLNPETELWLHKHFSGPQPAQPQED